MKIGLLLFALFGITKQCSKYNPYAMLNNNSHPEYVHQMELFLADDRNSDDSATAENADRFLNEFDIVFKDYQPDTKVIDKLKKYAADIEVKVVGGNWCSDTRIQVPRFCKVLYYAGVPTNKFSYYRVDRDKKAVSDDFAAKCNITSVPDMVIFYKGKEAGHIIEVPKTTLEKDLLAIIKNAD